LPLIAAFLLAATLVTDAALVVIGLRMGRLACGCPKLCRGCSGDMSVLVDEAVAA